MKTKPRDKRHYDAIFISMATAKLQEALAILRDNHLHAPKFAAKIRRAVKSGEGAVRHHQSMEAAAYFRQRASDDRISDSITDKMIVARETA